MWHLPDFSHVFPGHSLGEGRDGERGWVPAGNGNRSANLIAVDTLPCQDDVW